MKKFDLSTEEKRNEVFELFKSFNKKGDIYGYLNTSDNGISISYVNEVAHIINFDFITILGAYLLRKQFF